ncbi:MAG: GNAT family N-acetyltransferase [Rhizomicrobium sp.]
MIAIRRLTDLPPDIEILRSEAAADGIRNMGILVADWRSGAERYGKPGEALFGAFDGARLVGVGCVKIEPAVPAMRMRRLYVLRDARRHGVGRLLAQAMIARGFETAGRLTCNAVPPGAGEFWDAMAFERVAAEGWTHEMRR